MRKCKRFFAFVTSHFGSGRMDSATPRDADCGAIGSRAHSSIRSRASQGHYTVSGKPARDASRMGLYFRKDAPKYQMRSAVLLNPKLRIPANTKAHTESASKRSSTK